ncbi:MAG: hypothetical protein AAGF90_23840 [Pseudomonadota bacterium]
MRQIFACVVVLTLAACASQPASGTAWGGSISRLQCQGADWYNVGLYDGSIDRAQPARFAFVSQTCDSHGVRADRDEYFRGYADGQARRSG